MKKQPLRMCIACREMVPKNELIRIVRVGENDFELDTVGKKPGRGAYICNKRECIEKCLKQKSLNRAFSCNVDPEVYTKIKESYDKEV